MAQQIDIVANLLMKVDGAEAGINKLKNSLSKLKMPEGLENSFKKSFANLDVIFARYRSQVEKGFSTKADVTNFAKTGKALDAELDRISKHFTELTGKQVDFKINSAEITKTEEELTKLIAQRNELAKSSIKFEITGAKEGYKDIESLLTKLKEVAGNTKTGQYASGALDFLKQGDLQSALVLLDKASVSCKRLNQDKQDLFSATGLDMSTAIKKIVEELTGAEGKFGNVNTEVIKFEQILADLRTGQIKDAGDLAKRLADDMLNAGSAIKQADGEMQDFAQSSFNMSQQLSQLQQSTQYFFGLRNMINLLKRGVKEAISTIKELDAAMTQTAVVTTFDVSDMWAKLPEYTANANALGATVKDMYEATTLYYQQGLDTQQAMGIATETMKMARIGGLEAADATDKMTAALRGFNMELNETSAQRVNDVYSNLAAKTASNTEELGTAMQRTASIAASAGMSFEGTAAFLAQAIETTREPAENLGTAMKTIVARFTELKKNPLEISEVDGEEVDYNKVDTALKSIGVSLKDTNGQFRALDEVFLDISQRWDSLTQTQQRYIATTAAGSRQQSRFIAMMSNYDRTMQLMEYANNSAGASQEQFGKTLDSLEAKLNKFQNAWKEFLMGIMNDSWTKGVVTGATKILDVVNKITDLLSGNGKLKGIKSMLSLFTAFTALKFAGRGINGLIGGLGGMLDPRVGFKGGFSNGALGGQAAKISNPIVQAIHGLIPHIDKAVTGGLQYKGYGDFKGAKRELNNQFNPLSIQTKSGLIELNTGTGKYSLSGVQDIFSKNGINEAQQKALYASYPGLKHNMTKTLAKVLQESGADPKTTKGLIAGFKQGDFTSAQVLEKAGLVRSFYNEMKVIGEKSGQEAANAFRRAETKELVSGGLDKKIVQQGKDLGYKGKDLTNYVRGEIDKRVNTKTYATSDKAQAALDAEQELSKAEKLANGFGAVGGALTSAGMSLQMFGSQLSAVNPLLGDMITKLGGLLSAAGSIPNMISSIIAGGPAVWALTAAVTALGAAFLYTQHQEQKIKDAAKEVSDNFKKTNQETQDNIAKLKEYRGELATLSKGVDSNGNNINLSDTDYQRYLEIVDDIAAINPEIVDGYNAQGHAIINNNKALADTLAIQEEIRDKAFKDYIDVDSGALQKLINARNIDKNYKASTTSYEGNNYQTGVTPLTDNVIRVAKELKKADWFDESMLEAYGIHSLDSLLKGEEQAVNSFVKYQDKINTQLSGVAGDKITTGLTESFENLSEQTGLFDEAIKPVYDNLLTQVSQSSFFSSIAPEFRDALNIGLKDLASQDLSASEMSKAANNMAARFANLTTGSGKYADALKIVEEAQDDFATTLNETEYRANVQPAIDDLVKLKEEALEEGTAYGNALADYLDNQIARISNFTEEGAANLTEALNTATDDIAAAEGALDNFNNATKTDYSTAAEGMKSIFEKTTETFKDSYGSEIQKHAEGMGDATFWTGAEALLSGSELERLTSGKNGYEAAEAVAKRIKDLEPMLREGQEGFDAFTDRVLENADAMDKLAEAGVTYDKESGLITNIPEDQWHNVAEALGISDDLLTSMLNKGRQFADISFMNLDDAQKALATSDFTIKGTQAAPGEQQNLYVKEDTLRAELANAGYVRKEQQDEQIEKLLAKGVKTIPAADSKDLTADTLKAYADDWGIKTLPDLIQTLNDTGDFTKDEIKAYADKLGLLTDEGRFDSLYSDIIEAAENPELAKQTSELEHISAQLGILINNKTIDQAEQDHKDARKELYGKTGGEIDSEADFFAHGQKKDENGNIVALTAGEYEETKKSLIATGEIYKQQAEEARIKAAQATGDEKKRWETLAEGYEQDYNNIQTYLDLGAKAFEKNQQEIDNELAARKSKDEWRTKQKEREMENASKGSAEDWYNKYGFGNTDINNRQQLNWGSEPYKQGKNWNNAQQWGETEDSLRNSISTYLAQAMTFGEGENAIALTFTPMLQGENGTPEVLSPSTVDNYLNTIISKATDNNGKVNLQELFELDKQGLEIEGQEINNLLMGAFTGEGMDEASNALGALEHQLESNKQKASDLNKEMNQGTKPKADTNKTPSTPTSQPPLAAQHAEDHDIRYHVNVEGEEQLDDAEQKGISLEQVAAAGIDFLINASYPGLSGALGAIQQVKDATASEPTLQVDADTSPITTMATKIAGIVGTYTVKIAATSSGLSGILSTLSSIASRISSINSTKVRPAAKGQNNYIPYRAPIHTGSLAKGTKSRYGQVGPKNKGGLTLTGEKGFEIAWLPSENRSMILGTTGPQMLNLPADAVVYTHKQSKEILKRQSIPAGSHAASQSASSYQKKYTASVTSYSSSGSSKSKNSGSSKSSTSKSKKTINNFSLEEVIRFDIDQTLAKLNSDINKKAKEIEKSLTKIGGVYDDIADSVDKQIQALQQVKVNNQALVDSYIRQLKAIDEGTYEQSISWTDSNGDSQEAVYNLSKYIYKDAAGTYKVDYDKIKALGSNAEREAVFKAAESAISSLQSGLLKAQEAVDDAKEKMAELGKKVSETFYQWENELTEIYDLTQRINDETSFTNRFVSQVELELSKLNAGFGQTEKAIENTRKVLTRNNDTIQRQIADQKQIIAARQRELNLMLSAVDEQEKLNKYQNMTDIDEATKTANIEWAQDKVTVAETALKYVANVFRDLDGSVTYEIDWASFNADNDQSPMNKETYEAVKKYLDDLNSAATEFNNSIKEQTDFIKQTYDALRKYQDDIADMESTLIKGVEEQIENAKNNAKTLSDSITNALKDLLDEVKRKLDERRKQEDNAKTERDIAQKQQRLAALRANTSGGNQVEIAQLEKEIADAQQSYGRTLEDQLLDRLQQQGDEAAKQRERQIELMEISNRTEASTNQELVDMWLKNPQAYKDKIKEAWLEAQGYADKGEAGQYVLDNEFESKFTELTTAVEQSGFNNLEAPFTAIEGNTNTLVALLQKLISEENNAVQDATERNTEILKDLTKDVEGAKKAYSKGVDAKTLKDKFGFDAKTLAGGGYTPSDLRRAGFGVGDLVSAGITDVKTLKDAGFNDATAIKTALGETNAKGISDYKSAGFTAKDLKGLFNDAELIDLFDAKALKEAEFTVSELKGKFNILQLKDAGYTLPQLKDAFKASEFGAGGISYADARAAGFTAQQLKSVAQYAKQAAAELQPKVSQGRDLAYGSQGSDVKLLQQTLNKLGIRDNSGNSLDVDGDFGQHTREAVINFQKKYRNKASKTLSADGVVGYYTKEAFKALGYKTGGLADYTGPAWLDGTPSKPELVLNATDTKNFLALRDVLSSAMKSTSSVANAYGGNATYEININVDKLTSDYDVDKVAERVKKIIVKDSSYRNVTQVRNFR